MKGYHNKPEPRRGSPRTAGSHRTWPRRERLYLRRGPAQGHDHTAARRYRSVERVWPSIPPSRVAVIGVPDESGRVVKAVVALTEARAEIIASPRATGPTSARDRRHRGRLAAQHPPQNPEETSEADWRMPAASLSSYDASLDDLLDACTRRARCEFRFRHRRPGALFEAPSAG